MTTGTRQHDERGLDREQVIRDNLGRLSKWFRKSLDTDQKAEYMRALQYIPPEAMDAITQGAIEDTPAMPARFPTISQLKQRWYDWQAANPQMKAQYPKVDCQVCQSEFGLLNGVRVVEGNTYRVIARCSACENWLSEISRESKAVPLMTPGQMTANGWDLEFPPKSPLGPKPIPRPVKQLARAVGTHTNPGQRREYFDDLNKRRDGAQ